MYLLYCMVCGRNVSAVLHGVWEECICCIAWCVGATVNLMMYHDDVMRDMVCGSNVSAVLHGVWGPVMYLLYCMAVALHKNTNKQICGRTCICCIAWCVGVMYLLYCMVCGSNVSAGISNDQSSCSPNIGQS